MIKIKVVEDTETIKNKLFPIRDEICIVQNRKNRDDFIVTYDHHIDFIKKHLTINFVEEFSEMNKIDFIISNDNNDMSFTGRADFLT